MASRWRSTRPGSSRQIRPSSVAAAARLATWSAVSGPNADWLPSDNTTSSASTWSIVMPYRTDWLPAELLPIIPPSVARFLVEVSGPNISPCPAAAQVELLLHDAGLHPGHLPLGVDRDDRAHVPGQVHHDRPADRLAGQAGPGAPGQDRDAELGGCSHDGRHVGRRPAGRPRRPARSRTCSRRGRKGACCSVSNRTSPFTTRRSAAASSALRSGRSGAMTERTWT